MPVYGILYTCAWYIVHLCMVYCTPVCGIWYTCVWYMVHLCVVYGTPVCSIWYTCVWYMVHLCDILYTCVWYIVHLCMGYSDSYLMGQHQPSGIPFKNTFLICWKCVKLVLLVQQCLEPRTVYMGAPNKRL